MALGASHLVPQKLPEHPLVQQVGERIARGVVLQILVVLVDRLDGADHVQKGGQDAVDDQRADRIDRDPGLHADADHAADLRRLDEERFGLQLDLFPVQVQHGAVRIDDVVHHLDVGRGDQRVFFFPHPLIDGLLDQFPGRIGGGVEPEDVDVVDHLFHLEDAEDGVGGHDLVDLAKQVTHPLLPVTDGLGGDDEALQHLDLELQHLLADGHVLDAGDEGVEFGEDVVQFPKPEVLAFQLQRGQIRHVVDAAHLAPQDVEGRTDVPVDVAGDEKRHQKRDRGEQPEDQEETDQEGVARAADILADGKHPQHLARRGAGMAA